MKKLFFPVLLFFIWANSCLAGVSVIGGLSRENTAKPGERLEGVILLKNTGESPAEVKVYQTDFLSYADGRNIYGEPGSTPRSSAGWISLSPSRLVIPPQNTASVYYDLRLPADKALKGTYWSVVMVEPIPETSPESMTGEKGKIKIGIRAVIRYGIQIVTDIGDTGERRIRFSDKRLLSRDGQKILRLDIENTGDRWLSPLVWADLFTEPGRSIGRFESGRFRIYPGCSVRHRINLTGVPAGKYRALVVVDNGDEYVFGARYDLEIE